MRPHRKTPLPRAILAGEQEGAFDRLPETVIANLRRPHSENALLWNTFYPQPGGSIRLESLLAIKPLWGTCLEAPTEEALEPYFWGFNAGGQALPGLEQALDEVDGPGPRTEIDLLLLGPSSLIVIEAKNLSTLGRCGRHQRRVCPDVHLSADRWLEQCRYWEVPPRASIGSSTSVLVRAPVRLVPACARHYQLGANSSSWVTRWLVDTRCGCTSGFCCLGSAGRRSSGHG